MAPHKKIVIIFSIIFFFPLFTGSTNTFAAENKKGFSFGKLTSNFSKNVSQHFRKKSVEPSTDAVTLKKETGISSVLNSFPHNTGFEKDSSLSKPDVKQSAPLVEVKKDASLTEGRLLSREPEIPISPEPEKRPDEQIVVSSPNPDIDQDGCVGESDKNIVLNQWGACDHCAADLNGDNHVNSSDLSIVLAQWSCPAATSTPVPQNPDIDQNGCVGESDKDILLSQWRTPCDEGCTADLNADGQVNGHDLSMLLAQWSCPATEPPNLNACDDPQKDEFYLLKEEDGFHIELVNNGMAFKAVLNGREIKSIVPNERYVIDHTLGQLDIDYQIIPQDCGGVNIVYSVHNPKTYALRMPDFQVQGINHKPEHLKYLHTNHYGNLRNVDQAQTLTTNRHYPHNYAAVMATVDQDFAVGTAMLYPYMEYLEAIKQTLKKVSVDGHVTYEHMFHDIRKEDYPGPGLKYLPAGATQEYTLTVRFSKPRNWLLTLHDYKKYFKNLYGTQETQADKNLKPIRGVQLAYEQFYHPVTNPRAYNTAYRIHDLGWGPFVDQFINETKAKGYTRTMLWVPSGRYLNPAHNFAAQFMDFLPHLEADDGHFQKFAQNNLTLGFWHGRSGQVPNPIDAQWDPASLEAADYNNPAHMTFINNQYQKAYNRGSREVGLDAIPWMKLSGRYQWADDITHNFPGMHLCHEGAGPDIMHSKMANFHWPEMNVPLERPDLLSHYLNPGSEVWAFYRSFNHINFEDMQKLTSWGYTVITIGSASNIDVNNLDYTQVACLDGIDNDNDGLVDFPYDPDCESEIDNDESPHLPDNNTAYRPSVSFQDQQAPEQSF